MNQNSHLLPDSLGRGNLTFCIRGTLSIECVMLKRWTIGRPVCSFRASFALPMAAGKKGPRLTT